MSNTIEIFYQQYESDVVRERFARLDELLHVLADKLNLHPSEWRFLMDCLNVGFFEHELHLQPGIIESAIVDSAHHEPERFNRWCVDLAALKAKIEPLSALQRLALCYRVHWLFELPPDEQDRGVWSEQVEAI